MLTTETIDRALGTLQELLDEVARIRGLGKDFDDILSAIDAVERLSSLAPPPSDNGVTEGRHGYIDWVPIEDCPAQLKDGHGQILIWIGYAALGTFSADGHWLVGEQGDVEHPTHFAQVNSPR